MALGQQQTVVIRLEAKTRGQFGYSVAEEVCLGDVRWMVSNFIFSARRQALSGLDYDLQEHDDHG